MVRLLTYIGLTGSLLLSSVSAQADINHGKELHDSNCTSCHISIQGGDGTGIYTRENNRIETYPALIKQVKRCRDSLGMQWPEDHISDVVEYLNTTFYKFKE
jgi:mono/diheme cytochrome c family protein